MKDEWTVDTHLSVIVSLWALVFMQLYVLEPNWTLLY